MMVLNLKRKEHEYYTTGELFINGEFFCYTLEDKVRPKKVRNVTAIPYGVYNCTLTYSPRFQRELPLVKDVPNFEGIRIHSGNTVDDTSGCILVGYERAGDRISRSRSAERDLVERLRGEEVKLIIEKEA